MDNLKISVIVPIYNTEAYLSQCIQSIRNQTYENIEIILVNDGSTDDSRRICEEAKGQDGRVHVIDKSNGGPASARKEGIKRASGDYVCFVDSDDWVEEDMCQGYRDILRRYDADIVVSGFLGESGEDVRVMTQLLEEGYYRLDEMPSAFITDIIFDKKVDRGIVTPSLWGKCFRRDIVKKNILSMDDTIRNGEDGGVWIPTLLDAKGLYSSEKCWYHYRARELSQSRTVADDYFEKTGILHRHLVSECSVRQADECIFYSIERYTEVLIRNGVLKRSGIKINRKWLFPYEAVESDSAIIVYGAGDVGISYHRQLLANGYCKVVMMVDKRFETLSSDKLTIASPEKVKGAEADAIVIAIEDDKVRAAIAQELKERVGVSMPIIAHKPAYL